jgi:hypothetical protein
MGQLAFGGGSLHFGGFNPGRGCGDIRFNLLCAVHPNYEMDKQMPPIYNKKGRPLAAFFQFLIF